MQMQYYWEKKLPKKKSGLFEQRTSNKKQFIFDSGWLEQQQAN